MTASLPASAPGCLPGHSTNWIRRGLLLLVCTFFAATAANAQTQQSLQFDGIAAPNNDYVTFGAAPSLGASVFTIEVRFKRTGTGLVTSTGSGANPANGFQNVVPLLAKGRGQADGSNVDANYFLGIRTTDNRLVADYEDFAASNNNHAIFGSTNIQNNVWYHAAATYDGATFSLYLNGNLEASVATTAQPRFDSIQHASLGTAMNSTGMAEGFFAGLLDEARIWNVARTQQQITDNQNLEILAAPGLLGRWSFNEGTGNTAGNSLANGVNGTLTNSPTYSTDSPLSLASEAALRLYSTTGYVTFGDASALHLPAFTVETWFRRDGAGATAETGTGGVIAVPLVTRGTGEAETTAADMNYFLGIRGTDNVLVADFEEGAGGATPSQNHPVAGVTAISNGVWYHAAATYDGTTWRLYLNGVLEASVVVGQPVAAAGTQHAALGSALTTAGAQEGAFTGGMDEARVWNYARTQAEIQSTINSQLNGPVSGLVARWGLNEDAGTAVASTAGTPVTGTITGTGWTWGSVAPFNITPPTPPLAPSGLTATPFSSSRIDLSWTDNATNETAYEVELSTTGIGGTYTLLISLPAGTTTYSHTGLSASTQYCYRVRAVNGGGPSAYDGPQCATTLVQPATALDFGAAGNTYASFGNPAALKLSTLTLEMWMRRDGPGVGTDTGASGIPNLIPLIAKGRAETEAAAVDVNYIFGIRASDGVLCADFEEGAAGTTPSLNHPVFGTTVITNGVWHHVAATYDGTWKLYLDGNLEATLVVNQPLASGSDVAVSLASALNSTNVASGFFNGVVDEVRIWNVARTQVDIQAAANLQISTPMSGLVARWSLDEGTGSAINGSAGTTINGTITGTDFTWVGPAPFNLSFTPPDAAPSGLAATAISNSQINLSWTDNSSNEAGFEIERSTTGSGGTYTLLTTRPANSTNYSDTGLSNLTEYCYRIRAINGNGQSSYDGPQCATTLAAPAFALDFAGATYVSFGDPAVLDLAQFTVECWFRRDGTGTITSTGSGGITNAIPLVTKGTSESDGSNVDMNFFLGIDDATDRLVADFEEGSGGTTPGLNHPVTGTTTIVNGDWHHAAVTYNGTAWALYMDGNLEASLAVGQPCQSQSIQPAALATSIRSNGTTLQGFFDGVLDEVRIWNFARSHAQIQGTANAQITTAQTGLVARWGLEEGSGTAINGTAGTTVNGNISGVNYTWVGGAPFNLDLNLPPAQPALNNPAHLATGVGLSPNLDVHVSDPDADNLTVTYYGRPLIGGPAGPDFTLIGMPDTQYYTGEDNGATNAILLSINNWIVANRASRNIVYVATLGDCVELGDNGGNDVEWQNADAGYSLIENPVTTGLPEGIPYGITVGNHDQSPNGDPQGTTTFYNQYFGEARFSGRDYYGGHYGSNNDNWYDVFSASGMNFIVVSFEYDTSPDQPILDWAEGLIAADPGRRAIVLSHNLCGTGNPASFSTQGTATYNALRDNPNFFLMMAGHVPGEGRRSDTFNGNTVNTLMSDYQGRTNGGNGWIRIMTFSPANNTIEVETYSPWLGQFETDADSRFTLTYNMSNTPSFQVLGTNSGVPSNTDTQFAWSGLLPNTTYEWYATVSDGQATTTGPVWRFTTAADGGPPSAQVVSPNGAEILTIGNSVNLQWSANDDLGVSGVDLLLSRNGAAGTYETIATNVPNSGTYAWTVTGPPTIDAYLKVVAHDFASNSAQDVSDASFHITDGVLGVDGGPVLDFALDPVAPNPVLRKAHIGFALPQPAQVRLSVFDLQGREVARLADQVFPAGRHKRDWDGRSDGGAPASSGLYFVRLQVAGRTFMRRMTFVN